MTLFNDPIRIKDGRVISLLPTPKGASHRRGQAGPQRTWTLAYPTPPAATLDRPSSTRGWER